MALLTWIIIFPLITLVVILLEPLLEELTRVSRLAITTAVTVPIMTWLVMPRVPGSCAAGSIPIADPGASDVDPRTGDTMTTIPTLSADLG
jgi:uncharacterized protein